MNNTEIKKYDDNGNLIYIEFISGYKIWREYNENNNIIYWRNSNGFEMWFKHNENNNEIKITKQEYENIKIKEYNSRTKCSRFEIMDI